MLKNRTMAEKILFKIHIIFFFIFYNYYSAYALETKSSNTTNSDSDLIVNDNTTDNEDIEIETENKIPNEIQTTPDEEKEEEKEEEGNEEENEKEVLYWDQTKYGLQVGTASLYSGKFHGRRTASGEPHDKKLQTAAHKKLPFGTEVKVTNLQSGENFGRSVFVTINDRGPFIKGRIIDLSLEAAKKIGLTKRNGITKVKIQVVKQGVANNNNGNENTISNNNSEN